MTYGAYPARRTVAERVRECFARHLAVAALGPVDDAAPLPATEAIEALIELGFWTSLRREEGYVPIVSLALLPPETSPRALHFARPLPLSPSAVAKVSPAVERPGIHLGVSMLDGELCIWGATRN